MNDVILNRKYSLTDFLVLNIIKTTSKRQSESNVSQVLGLQRGFCKMQVPNTSKLKLLVSKYIIKQVSL